MKKSCRDSLKSFEITGKDELWLDKISRRVFIMKTFVSKQWNQEVF
jgi:hypothetical protein|eukprot:GDKH01017247.1.p1 GENE.GDKH01017247.1~~GDKH01017247.1.p1  ORF type:complete len:54 (-),score=0.29 GDKH01017247.1:40-177(-)